MWFRYRCCRSLNFGDFFDYGDVVGVRLLSADWRLNVNVRRGSGSESHGSRASGEFVILLKPQAIVESEVAARSPQYET